MTAPTFDLFELRRRCEPELDALVTPTQASPEGSKAERASRTLGEALYPEKTAEELVEVNRTLVGVRALYWLYNDQYEEFTACQAGDPHRLTRETFEELRDYVREVIGEPGTPGASERFRAMEYLVVINDLGKIQQVIDEVERRSGEVEVDHDRILLKVLERYPDLAPSLGGMLERGEFRETELGLIVDGLRMDFNVPQLMQLESVAASLSGIEGVDQDPVDFWVLHALADLAGARGAKAQNGSLTVNEPTARNFLLVAEQVRQPNRTARGVYDGYEDGYAEQRNLKEVGPAWPQIARFCGQLQSPDEDDSKLIARAFLSLPSSVRKPILEDELAVTGLDGKRALLLYYLPALMRNARAAGLKAGQTPLQALQTGMLIAAREYKQARIAHRREKEDGGVRIVMSSALASAASADLEALSQQEMRIDAAGADSVARLVEPVKIDPAVLKQGGPLADVTGERVVLVGAGGGSDCVQAAALGLLLERSGKRCAAVISVRSARTGSQGTSGKIGERRTVSNHGGEIHAGTFAITPETTGSGRFLESVPAADVPMFLAIDDGAVGSLTAQLQSVIDHPDIGGADTVLVVDTGGDSLYQVVDDDQALATPDQDIRTLRSANDLAGVQVISCVVAPGLDAPHNAEFVLQVGKADYRELDESDASFILETLSRWRMDGSDPERIGKMCLGWQAGLQGKTGMQVLPLPEHLVTSEVNPWSPFANISATVKGIATLKTRDHLVAVGANMRPKLQRREDLRRGFRLGAPPYAPYANDEFGRRQGRRGGDGRSPRSS